MSIKSILIAASLFWIATARAHLGDSYATAARELAPLKSHTVRDWVVWNSEDVTKSNVWMQFHENRCVAIYYVGANANTTVLENEIQRLLKVNSTRGSIKSAQHWTEGLQTIEGCRQFSTDDGEMMALVSPTGQWLRVAYTSWLQRHHLLFSSPVAEPSPSPTDSPDSSPTASPSATASATPYDLRTDKRLRAYSFRNTEQQI
jgi:hypothetical protein